MIHWSTGCNDGRSLETLLWDQSVGRSPEPAGFAAEKPATRAEWRNNPHSAQASRVWILGWWRLNSSHYRLLKYA